MRGQAIRQLQHTETNMQFAARRLEGVEIEITLRPDDRRTREIVSCGIGRVLPVHNGTKQTGKSDTIGG